MESLDTTLRPTASASPADLGHARRLPNGIRPLPFIGWTVIVALALFFVAKNALQYYHGGTAHDTYGTLAGWIRLHVAAGTGALFAGLAQFRTGLRGGRWPLHRLVGRLYLGSIVVASVAAVVLLTRNAAGWVTTSGLAALAVAWVTTTGLAWIAIRRGNVIQHREWMLRSYVVTFAFVNFRILYDILGATHVGNWHDRTAVSSWFSWAVPLLITELMLQGRKVFATPVRQRTRLAQR